MRCRVSLFEFLVFFFVALSCCVAQAPGTDSPCPDGSQPVSCLVNPCTTATCPAYPDATCTANYCGGCNAVFTLAGQLVDCSTVVTECPDGSTPVRCLVDPCTSATCSAHPDATCTANYCGGCNAVFTVHGQVVNCSDTVTRCSDGSTPVNCLIDPCTTATCPAHPDATCTANYCGGCNAVFTVQGEAVNCSDPATRCPDGSTPVNCLVNPCTTATCPAHPDATCTANYCGGCHAVFTVQGETVDCSAPATGCPDGSTPVNCLVNPCTTATCPAHPDATCTANYCGGCHAVFTVHGQTVDCSAPATRCPDGSTPVNCLINPCTTATCPAYPDATCIADYCGGCKAKFTFNGQIVDCNRTGTCSYKGFTYQDGESFRMDCNTCHCDQGRTMCTEIACRDSPCASANCKIGYTCVTGTDGNATCIPIHGKPGICPVQIPSAAGNSCQDSCSGDASCPGNQKCCRGDCGAQCVDPVTPTAIKPGTCPADNSDSSQCSIECSSDTDCFGINKCCSSGCSRKCVRPSETPCKECDPQLLPALRILCSDGTTAGYECNLRSCQWELKPCSHCSCTPSVTPVACPGASKENPCGRVVCSSIDGACAGSWSCDDCEVTSVPPQKKCIRAGCQGEKCVGVDDAITLECATWSPSIACLHYSSCEYNETTSSCGWTQTTEYLTCLKHPEDSTPCQSRYPCECLSNPACGWCSTFDTLESGVVLSWGQCMPASLEAKCLASKSDSGFAGTFLSATDACTVKRGNVLLDKINSQIQGSHVQTSISAEVDGDSDISAKFTLVLQTIIGASVSEDNSSIVYLSNFVKILGPEPSEAELDKLCHLISSGFAKNLGLSLDKFSECKLTKVQDGTTSSTAKREVLQNTAGTYLHQAAIENVSGPASASATLKSLLATIMTLVASGFFLTFSMS